MASIVQPLTAAASLPDTLQAVANRPVASAHWLRVADTIHHTHARAQGFRVSQSWAGSVCSLDGTPGRNQYVRGWRIPLASSEHVSLVCRAEATLTAGSAAKLRFVSSAGTADLTPPAAGARGWCSVGVLALPAYAVGTVFDDITMEWFGLDPGEVLTVHTVSLYIERLPIGGALTAALIAAPGSSFAPVGNATLAPDYPLASPRLTQMLTDLTSLYQRPRTVFCWSALDPDVTAYVGTAAPAYMQRRPYLSMPRLQRGDETYAGTYTAWALVLRSGVSRNLVWQTLPEGPQTTVTVAPGGAASVWVSTTIDLRGAPNCVPGWQDRSTGIALEWSNTTGEAPTTQCEVYSATVWGV